MEYHNPSSSYSVSSSSNRSLSPSPNSTVYHHCLTTLNGHTSSISSLTLSAKFLYTGSSDSQIISWNLIPSSSSSSSNNTTVVLAGNGAVKSLIIHSNKLFSAHQDHKIRVWKIKITNHELNKYTHVATLPTLGDRASKILIPKNHVQIRRHKKRTWVHHVDAVSSLALSHDGASLYSVSWDRTLKVWRTNDFACLESLPDAHRDAINAVVVSRDGRVFTASADHTIKVWKKFQGENKHTLLQTLESHHSGVNALALSTDQNVLYSAASDRDILVWEKDGDGDVDDGDGGDGKMGVVGAMRGHTKSILCLCVVEDLVCSGSADKTIRIWRGINVYPHQYSCLAVLEGHTGSIKCISAMVDHSNNTSHSQSSFLIYSGALDCHVKVWQILLPAF